MGEAINHSVPMLIDQDFVHSGKLCNHSGQLVQHPQPDRLGHGPTLDLSLGIMWRK